MEKKESASRLSLRAVLAVLMMFFAVTLSAQNISVKGSVVDQSGEPLMVITRLAVLPVRHWSSLTSGLHRKRSM